MQCQPFSFLMFSTGVFACNALSCTAHANSEYECPIELTALHWSLAVLARADSNLLSTGAAEKAAACFGRTMLEIVCIVAQLGRWGSVVAHPCFVGKVLEAAGLKVNLLLLQ